MDEAVAPAAMRITCLVFPLALAGIGMMAACQPAQKPRGLISTITRQEHPALVNGEMDWGSEVGFDLANQGDRGMLHVTVTLSCSEGQWARQQDLLLDPKQSVHLSYFFEEPTINATNFQARVGVSP